MKKAIVISICLIFSFVSFSQNSCKCCSEKHQEFDFWIGSWTVTNADGSVAGYSTISKIQDNCVIDENWKSVSQGYTGISHNFYNSKTEQWEQVWLDNQGSLLKLFGGREGNQMILRSETVKTNDGEVYNKIIWTANSDGTVSQRWEMITNNTNIAVAFDGLYKKEN